MKKLFLTTATALASIISTNTAMAETYVTWQVVENNDDNYVHRFTIKGDMDFDILAFNMLPRKITAITPGDTVREIIPAYYALSSKRIAPGVDSVVVDMVTPGMFANISYAPDGLHTVGKDGAVRPVKFTAKPVTRKCQWSNKKIDLMPDAADIFNTNEMLLGGSASYYDAIPSYKHVTPLNGTSNKHISHAYLKTDHNMQPEMYSIVLQGGSLVVKAQDIKTARIAFDNFFNKYLKGENASIPNVEIVDYPSFQYRGVMIDVSRNFQTLETMRKIVDQLAYYRMNRLHFHLVDDEAWRIEIPALPELTQYAGRRGYSTDEKDFLYQIYSGDGNPDSKTGVSNGYYTADEFIDFLRYAYDKGVFVIPEIEMPGHARAAVKAMEARYRNTGDDSFRMRHDGDTSTYTSAQAYHDNVMNPALPGTYKFIDVVFDAIIDMYKKADVPLLTIHIGGDEVAKGAWDGSEKARELMQKENLASQTALHGWFVEKIAAMLKQKGVNFSGWQEIAVGHTPEYNQSMSPITYSVNCWTQSNPDPEKSITTRALKAGFPVVLSNVNHFYLDMIYNYHPNEPGLKWGGTVDELTSLHGYVDALCPVDDSTTPGKIKGMSGHLFSETIRSPQMLEYYIFPKMLGLAERCWNADTTYTDADFHHVIIEKEMPRWIKENINFHLRQPGIKVADGIVMINSPYPNAVIRYTTDGSEPNEKSAVYKTPFSVADASEIRARIYHMGKQSLTTIYNPSNK